MTNITTGVTPGYAKEFRQSHFSQLARLAHLLPSRKTKFHDYTRSKPDVDYVFEYIDDLGEKGYMTGQSRGVRQGDHILLKHNQERVQYRVETIDYYSYPAGMWIALLSRAK